MSNDRHAFPPCEAQFPWREAFDCGGDGLWDWNLTTGEKRCSARWYALLGYDEAAFHAAGLSWRALLHPEDFVPTLQALGDYLAGRAEAYQASFRLRRQAGDWRWFASRARIVARVNGRPARLIGIHRDIDSQNRIEYAWRESQQRFSALFMQSPDAITVTACGERSQILEVNPACCALTGYTSEELLGADSALIAVWANPGQGRSVVDMLNGGQAVSDLQSFVRRKDGVEVPTSFSGRRILVGGEYRLLIIRRDISERTRIEARLRESEERWMFAVEGHGDALWDWDLDAGMVYRSPRWLELAGIPAAGQLCTQREWSEAVHPEDLPAVRAQNILLIKGRQEESAGDCRLIRPDGGIVWVAYRGRVVGRAPDGRVRRVIGTIRDITRRKQREHEQEMQRALIAQQGRLLMLGEMASVAAHEVNQPLTAIASYAAVCRRRLAGQPEIEQLVARIEQQALRAGEIVWRIRGFARRHKPQRDRVGVGELLRRVCEWIADDARARDVRIEIAIPEGLPPLQIDRIQVEQVLLNLIWNGIHAMEGIGGAKAIRVSAQPNVERQIEIRVADNGVGVPEPVALDIFKPFFTTRPDGLGLGLSICRGIIADHGGALWCSPGEGGGTVFSFSLPGADNDQDGAD